MDACSLTILLQMKRSTSDSVFFVQQVEDRTQHHHELELISVLNMPGVLPQDLIQARTTAALTTDPAHGNVVSSPV